MSHRWPALFFLCPRDSYFIPDHDPVVLPVQDQADAPAPGMASHRVVAIRILRAARSYPHGTVGRERRHAFHGHLIGTEARSRAQLARPVDCENADHAPVLVAPRVGVHLEDDAVRPVPPSAADQRTARARRSVGRSISVRQDAQPPRPLRDRERTSRLRRQHVSELLQGLIRVDERPRHLGGAPATVSPPSTLSLAWSAAAWWGGLAVCSRRPRPRPPRRRRRAPPQRRRDQARPAQLHASAGERAHSRSRGHSGPRPRVLSCSALSTHP